MTKEYKTMTNTVFKDYLSKQKDYFMNGLITREEYLNAQRLINTLSSK